MEEEIRDCVGMAINSVLVREDGGTVCVVKSRCWDVGESEGHHAFITHTSG
jgi:hypothetical protein